jgi:hypothetical protein
MASKIDIINSALVLVGDKPLNSLTEDRRAAVVANAIYQDVYEGELNKHRWGFARAIQPLNLLVTAPKDPRYKNAFQLPTDLLVAVQLIPNEYDYRRYGYELYSNQNEVSLDYIRKVTEAELPSYFIRLFTYALARDLSLSIRDETKIFQLMDGRYVVEGRNARFQDSQEFPAEAWTDAPFISPRF